jgi:hypothetical protein
VLGNLQRIIDLDSELLDRKRTVSLGSAAADS